MEPRPCGCLGPEGQVVELRPRAEEPGGGGRHPGANGAGAGPAGPRPFLRPRAVGARGLTAMHLTV